MSKLSIHVSNTEKKQQILENAINLPTDGSMRVIFETIPKTRTAQQRKAIEVYCKLLAEAFNDAGFSVQHVLSKTLDADWSQEMVKEAIFKKATGKMLDKKSTTDLTRDEVSKVYETINRFGAQFGVHVPFPEKNNAQSRGAT